MRTWFFPKTEIKKIKKILKRMMRITSEIRNRDVSMEFLVAEKIQAHRKRIEQERKTHLREFVEMARRWADRDISAKWRKGLSLGSA